MIFKTVRKNKNAPSQASLAELGGPTGNPGKLVCPVVLAGYIFDFY